MNIKQFVAFVFMCASPLAAQAGVDYSNADVSEQDLSGQNLAESSFVNAEVTRSNFSGSNLERSAFTNTSFNGGSLAGANLRNSTFMNVDFLKTDLRGADFSGSQFTNCNLSAAITDSATSFTDVDMVNTDLPGAKRAVRSAIPSGTTVVSNSVVSHSTAGGGMDIAVASSSGENVHVNMPGMNIIVGDAGKAGKGGTRVNMPGMNIAVDEPVVREVKTARAIADELQKPQARIDLTVNFAFDSDQILDAGHKQLFEIAQALKSPALAGKTIRIEGHTDSKGTDEYNKDLSYRRAVSVVSALGEKYQVNTAGLTMEGYGESQPVESNDSDYGRAMNRRVTLVNTGL